ncbi:hypothetical protein GCM10007216_04490 [Thalassobacillus devorans]|uniref:Alpha/beta hydrolase n=1 Tax=Thalassobacillus devorans TaxID=279813 RepID=A0ABQ1NHE5_9BACI|nr:hypothetical protein [Thalassobacillus devorans]NIK27357.1 hypothetical protein [Thalassobacillus devorans]GGC77094.1 hypothetical protein GCM10007216_04490 [Thalassobacillus devorans]
MKVEEKEILNGDKKLKFTHIQNNSNKVCFMFSGAGYTYDKPLFYYSTMKLIEDKVDIIHVHYNYSNNVLNLPITKLAKVITSDVYPIIEDVLARHEYEGVVFLGKSLGTIPIIDQLLAEFSESKFILLTPLLKYDVFMKILLESPRDLLVITGKSDHHYFVEKVEALDQKENIMVKEFEGANHYLEVEPFNTIGSISILSETIHAISKYIK